MITAAGTLSVNAAFLHEIKQDNRRLQDLLLALRVFATHAAAQNGHPRRLVNLLGELCDQLALHFSLEEAYGYFEDAIDVAPRMAERADLLKSEHGVLFNAIREIADDAEEADFQQLLLQRIPYIVQRFREFDTDLQQHESREIALIFEAFDDDIGVGD